MGSPILHRKRTPRYLPQRMLEWPPDPHLQTGPILNFPGRVSISVCTILCPRTLTVPGLPSKQPTPETTAGLIWAGALLLLLGLLWFVRGGFELRGNPL